MMSSDNSQSLPRQMTAVGTMGEIGQLFTVYEKNWNCKDCGQENYASRPRCFRCKKQKPIGETNYVLDPALEAARNNQTIQWQEVVDPASHQIYYYNKETGVTQWERPQEMGPAPMATGWFGRGVAGSSAAAQYKQLNDLYLSRPARKQKDFIDPKKYHVEGANEYNIWYGKYLGDHEKGGIKQEAAVDRCVLSTDAGVTKADSGGQQQRKDKRFFCIHFAHGVCAKGKDCVYYHRVPVPEDDARNDEMVDCFGRQRHAAHRDDMDGVGSFMKPCRTLFVANLLKSKYQTPKALEECLWRHFGEWGELESVNVIHRLSVAFPRYRLRTSAEFAKEAMQAQALDQKEILSIRWAHDDPNPVAQDSISRADKDALSLLLTAKGVSIAPAAFEYPSDYALPPPQTLTAGSETGEDGSGAGARDSKRVRLEDSGVSAELAYPNTDHQYINSANTRSSNNSNNYENTVIQQQQQQQANDTYFANMTEAEYITYCNHYYAQMNAAAPSSSSSSSSLTINPSSGAGGGIETNTIAATATTTVTSSSSASADTTDSGGFKLSSFLNDLIQPSSIDTTSSSSGSSSSNNNNSSSSSSSGNDSSSSSTEDTTNTTISATTTATSASDANGWSEHVDEDTGATYYYNASTGQSSWEAPPP